MKTVLIALACLLMLMGKDSGTNNTAQADTIKVKYVLEFRPSGQTGPFEPAITMVIDGNKEKQDRVFIAPGDTVTVRLLESDTTLKLGRWRADFNWREDRGKDPAVDHPLECYKTFTAQVGEGGITLDVNLFDVDGVSISESISLTAEDPEHTFKQTSQIASLNALMNLLGKNRRVRESDFRTSGSCADSKYKLQGSPRFIGFEPWSDPLVLEVEIDRVP